MQGKKMGGKNSRYISFAIFVAFAVLITVALVSPAKQLEKVPISRVLSEVQAGNVEKITVQGSELSVDLKEAITINDQEVTEVESFKESDTNISQLLTDAGADSSSVVIDAQPEDNSSQIWSGILLGFGPILLFVFILFYFMRQAQGQGNQAMNFGKSKAKLFGSDKKKVNFSDIAGNAESKQDLEEVVEFLKFPKKFEDVGAKIPKGVLLVGSPGTGKTLMARAVAGEAGVPFFSISGSEFVEMFVGVGASRVRDLFSKAKKNAPCIIFIDEIDAVGRKRGSGMGGGHDEREQTLNQILVEMDGFEQGANVIVIAATNRADVLDPALLRPGRFDRRVNINLPDRADREAILKVHFKEKPTDSSVNLDALAAKSAGSSGADLANIANESAIVAARNNRKTITNDDVTEAFERVAIGPERKNKIMSEEEKEMTAYHEAGHALVGHVLPNADPVHKVTIVSRGHTGGVTWSIPERDKSYHSILNFKDKMAVSLGGRIAEKLIYGDDEVTTGAGSDLKNASALARDMIIHQGMGKKLRNIVFNDDGGGMMFDRMVHDRPYSEDTAKIIDEEVKDLFDEAARRAEVVIKANMKSLKAMADKLLEVETLNDKEILALFKDTKLPTAAKL